ncbi:hypothetical protein FE257_008830 [Aspergillus nanangensis]|uniref:Uncharacterized protein n=1 Tax=Aspergillus nanangensis TaxID=2582783 RepID=A0AAD4CKL3_ASPNN|nr:hypothetical protein FE257_008830 [Aspergillus nanangensis]
MPGSDSDNHSTATDESSSHKTSRSFHREALFAHVALAVVNVLVSAGILLRLNTQTAADCRHDPIVPSPLHRILSYELHHLDGEDADKTGAEFLADSNATGPSSLESDDFA